MYSSNSSAKGTTIVNARSTGLRSTSLSQFSDVACCKIWACEHIFDASAMPWFERAISRNGILFPMMFFKMLERCWPGSVFLGKVRVAISDNIISRGYLNCVSDEIFTDALYSLLLGRAPDDAGRQYYDSQLRSGVSRDELIDHVLASDEFKEAGRNTKLASVAESDFVHVRKLIQDDLILYRPLGRADYFQPRPSISIGGISHNIASYLIYQAEPRSKPILAMGMNLVGHWDQDGHFVCGTDWIMFGPKINLRSGIYEIKLDIEAPSDFRFHFDACHSEGHEVVFHSTHKGDSKVTFCIPIRHDIPDFEVRLLNLTAVATKLKINEISIRLTNESE